MTAIKTSPELLMSFIFMVCVGVIMFANHVHNNNLVATFVNLAGQAFASITTLVVKGMVSNSGAVSAPSSPSVSTPAPTVTAQVESTTPKEKP